jgi:hypothetical protein
MADSFLDFTIAIPHKKYNCEVTPITKNHSRTAKLTGFKEICFMALKLISVPIKNKPNKRKILLVFLKNKIHESSKIKKEPAITKNINSKIKYGKSRLSFRLLKYQDESKTNGIIHKVLPSFMIVAISNASLPNMEAAPITEAVS